MQRYSILRSNGKYTKHMTTYIQEKHENSGVALWKYSKERESLFLGINMIMEAVIK